MEKPSLPKGTRDFGPVQMAKRQFIIDNIKKVFQTYGFQPLETPAMENLETLTGKYGEEGDQLLFKVLNSGDFLKDFQRQVLYRPDTEDQISVSLKSFHGTYFQFLSSHSDPKVAFDEAIKFSKDPIIKEISNSSYWLLFSIAQSKSKDEFSQFSFALRKLFLAFNRLENINSKDLIQNPSFSISEKGLRYDLTVPFARYVVMNRHEITFPFKRYQIQPVWRADRPQKGRYREFYQCDADVVGTDSLICEAEIILIIKDTFKLLGIGDYSIKINHRAILSGLAEIAGAKGNESSLFVAIDKLDKIGEAKVKEELQTRGFDEKSLIALFEILNFKGTTTQKTDFLSDKFSTSAIGQKGIADVKEVLNLLSSYGTTEDHVEFDLSLARGLSYYTGVIFEVKINNVSIGSVSGGGRYDNLTGVFGMPGVSGVGFSFGVDRLCDAMEELNLFSKETQISSKVMIAHMDEMTMRYGLKVVHALRQNGIASEIYPDQAKLKKQLEFANKKMIPFVIVIGSDEMKEGMLTFKNMETGEQQKHPLPDIIGLLLIHS